MSADFLTRQEDSSPARERRRPRLSPLERVMVPIAGISVAASCWLISSPGGISEAGARPWRPGSILHAVTAVMSLNFEYPTERGTEVKWLVQGLAGAVALAAGVIGWFLLSKREPEPGTETAARPSHLGLKGYAASLFTSLTPTNSAQMAFLLFAGWTFLSAWWAPWPVGAIGEAFRQVITIVWAVVLGRSLSARGARLTSVVLTVTLTLTAAIGLWYYFERNPEQRLKFPIGNPIFLAECLLPAVILPLSFLVMHGLAAASGRQVTAADPDTDCPGETARASSRWWILGAAVCLLLSGAALALTGTRWFGVLYGSRGPMLGLFFGLAAMVYLAVRRRYRWIVLGLAGVALVFVTSNLVTGMYEDAARGSTIRFRFYAWRIAVERFVVRPVSGTGQGGYLLGAQSKALDDFADDPAAFPHPIMDHAHNEWLQILSDLGAAGFGLVSTALGVTFWAAGLAYARLRNGRDRACLLGLVGSLAALIAAEATSVGLRKPVIPLIFYAVVGLIWALARSTEKHPPNIVSHPPGRGARILGATAGLAGAVVIAWLVIADWQGARAQYRMKELAVRKDWPQALEQASVARQMRLGIEDRVKAGADTADLAGRAAAFWLGELNEVLHRAREAGGLTVGARDVAVETGNRFEHFFTACMQSGEDVLGRFPHYPGVAAWLADALLLREQKQAVERQLGLRSEMQNHIPAARQWMAYEYRGNVLNAENALRLLQLTPAEEPLADRLDLIRVPLRAGPVDPLVRPLMANLMREAEFNSQLSTWMAAAQSTLQNPNSVWPDPYVPETLRLAGLREEIARDQMLNGVSVGRAERESQDAAARIADIAMPSARQAADLLLAVRPRFPSAASFARADQARYRLLSAPADPEAALALYRQALAEWMPGGSTEHERVLRAGLCTYLLAAGRDDEAVAALQQAFPGLNPRAVDLQLAASLQQLGQWFINASTGYRPARFASWITRLVELNPESANIQWMAAMMEVEQGRHEQAFEHIDRIASMEGGQHLETALRLLLKRFPDDSTLRELLRERTSQTEPASSAPASEPATTQSR